MKNKYILRFAFLASLFCGATGVFAQDANTNAPVPSVRDIDLCKDGTYDAMDGISSVDEGYDLIWFVDPTDTIGRALSMPPATTVDVTVPGKYSYYVAQRKKTAPYAQSDVVSFDVAVYGVMAPIDASTHEYCAHDAAEPLKAIKQENLLNYYGADDVWFKIGATEYEEVLPDTRVNSTKTYDYEAYQKFRIPLTGEVCIGPSIDIEVKVVAVGRPFFNGGVTYNKYEAEDTKEFEDILVKYPDAIESIPGQTLLWSKNETGPFVSGSTSSSKPTYDEFTPAGMTEIQNRWAIWKATTENGLVCQSEPSVIDIIIKSATAPLVKNVEICKDDYVAGAIDLKDFAIINDNNGMMSATDYQLYWYTDKAKAEAAIKDGPSEGSTTAPALNTIIDMTADPMSTEWEGEVYVVQSDGFTTSPASSMRITVNAEPKLQAIAHDPVCMGPVDLTSTEYWVIDNGIAATAQYTFNGSVVENPKVITQSGKYEITATSQHGCVSDPLKLQVDIRNLSIEMAAMSMTCPGGNVYSQVEIDYSYNKDSYAAPELSWTSKERGSTKPTQTGIITSADKTSFAYISGDFNGEAGDINDIEIEVTDGYCVSNAKHRVIIGNGPMEGTITWSENNNQSVDNGKSIPIKDDIEIHACGDIVNIDFSNVAMDADKVEWFKTNDYSMSPAKVGTLVSFSKEDYGTYYVRYTNGCYAYVTVSIIDASIQVKTADEGLVTLCEYGTYEIKVDIDCKTPERLTYLWYKDGTPYINSKQSLSFSPIQKTNEGAYSIVYSTEACVVTQPIVELKVKEYVKFDISGYEMYNGEKSCFVTSGDNVEIPLEYTVPSNSADINELKLSISDNASANKGSMETDNSTFYVTGVNEDHLVRIEAEGKNYCSGSIEFQILRDAKLKLDVSLSKDVLCLGESAELIIDTTGTGRFLHEEDYSLSVVSVTESGVETSDTGLVVEDGMIKKTISPTENTTYRVLFDYRGQSVEMEVVAKVFNFKVETKDTVICEGDAIELQYTASPAGTQVEWFNEDNVPLGTNPGIVVPEGQWTKGATKYTYTYWARPFSDLVICPSSSEMIPLHVEVDRPLEGYIKDQEICEGESVRIDASSYGATTYTWIVDGDTIQGERYFQATPEKDTEYQVLMSRGACNAKDSAIVKVMSNPVILSIDSVDVREREVILDSYLGTVTYQLRVDDGEWMDNTSLTNLSDGLHTLYVQDANGCSTSETFIVNQTDDVANIFADKADEIINVYTISGKLVKANVKRSEALDGLANGAYVIGGVKVIVNK